MQLLAVFWGFCESLIACGVWGFGVSGEVSGIADICGRRSFRRFRKKKDKHGLLGNGREEMSAVKPVLIK